MHLGRQYYYLSHTRRGLFPLTLGSHTQVFAELAPDTLAGPGDIVQRAADSAGEVDLDRALDITMEQWQLQTELLKARVQRVVEGEAAGYLGEGMDHVQCTSIVTKVAPSTAGDKRLMRALFREAMQLNPDTSTVLAEVRAGSGLLTLSSAGTALQLSLAG
jgi:hypothetical protein